MDCCKTTLRNEDEKKKLINRLNRINGQIKGLIRMVEEDKYCNDILVQSSAIGSALDSFNRELLGSHVRNCVIRDIKEGKEEVVEELLETIQRLM